MNLHKKTPMPFVWDAAQYCLELPYGAIRHFPAGTYNEQVATHLGRMELELMSVAHSAWYTFKHLKSYADWGEEERHFVGWMSKEPPPPPPTRRLDWILEALWGVSAWTSLVMDRMRGASGG